MATTALNPPKVRKGSLISFYGTQYTVNSVGSAKNDEILDQVNVTIAVINGKAITKNLWWTNFGGCEVIKY